MVDAGTPFDLDMEDLDAHYDDDELQLQPRLRHITSIQVRNLTPFPARDTLASALAQRSAPSHFTSQGHSPDDVDIALSLRRSRRISANSINSIRSLRAENTNDDVHASPDAQQTPTSRNRISSKASGVGRPSVSPSSPSTRRQQNTISFGKTPSVRPATRPRATSHVSITDVPRILEPALTASSSQVSPTVPAYASHATYRNSPKDLEKVIWSRLVESFITLSPFPEESTPPASDEPPGSTVHVSSDKSVHKRGTSSGSVTTRRTALGLTGASHPNTPNATSSGSPSKPSFPAKRELPSRGVSAPRGPSARGQKLPSTSSRPNPNPGPSLTSPRKVAFPHSPPLTPPPSNSSIEPRTPFYISPFHRPSTNPMFAFDAKEREFAEWADLSTSKVRISIWGRVEGATWAQKDAKGKGKEEAASPRADDSGEWSILHTWDVDFSELLPLSEDFDLHSLRLPANSLLITLLPHGRTYYVPSGFHGPSPIPSRPESPEYNSDPEGTHSTDRLGAKSEVLSSRRHRQVVRGRDRKVRTKEVKSAGYQDLDRLVTLQTCIIETQESLREIIQSCDLALEGDTLGKLRREVSEREHRVRMVREQRNAVQDDCDATQSLLHARREELRQRRAQLEEARAMHEEDLLSEFDNGARISEERKRHDALVTSLPRIRMSLLSILAFIFPIELLSSPDLLFTILSVPLPIPMTGTDPAPPLTLPSHPEVNEDGVATALGYAAQVVQLMAAYLCHPLVYPITYVGSRSLIKDPISSMMGPRMFPLYSRGVDTYRFEYAVFLLNKDIEMLMTDRNLRALDIRHTLPNLKNLLLTLTDGDGEQLRPPRLLNTPTTSPISRPADQLSLDSGKSPTSSPKASTSELPADTSLETNSPSSSSAYSISTVASFARKPKSYLGGLPPLTSMFRARHPSSLLKPSVKAVEETPEGSGDLDDSLENTPPATHRTVSEPDDEDDRRTIRGVSASDNAEDKALNGNGHIVPEEPEKLSDEPHVPLTPSLHVS